MSKIVDWEDRYVAEATKLLKSMDPWKGSEYKDDYYSSIFQSGEYEILFAKDEAQKIVGCVVWKLLGEHFPYGAYVRILAVSKDSRKKGLGSLLLKKAEERIFKSLKNIYITVNTSNTPAVGFYQKNGYSIIGKLDNYVLKGDEHDLLRKSIGPAWQ